ncbi:MAG TPA: APC family permease [Chloroflexota bacterium]
MSSEEKGPNPTPGEGRHPAPFHPDLVWREEVAGHRPGDRVVRIARHRYFRGMGHDVLRPQPAATEPKGGVGRFWSIAKHALIGAPIPTVREAEERLTKAKALAVLSSDALSSVAYGTEAAMRVLVYAGAAALALTLPISVAIALLLIIVATSYQQTIEAYPGGGGSYIVAHENLGQIPGLTAAASLLVDYVLTVAVSIAAGVLALVSAFPWLEPYQLQMSVALVVIVTILNLRGVRESGSVFAAPTYVFVIAVLGIIVFGLFKLATGGVAYVPGPAGPKAGTEALSLFLVLSAFARGCTAMTGTEAIANVVPVFKAPEPKNARLTLGWMAALLATMFVGISFLATHIGIIPDPAENETVLSQLTRILVGDSWYYYLVQFSTTLILALAANTSFNSFPRLLYIMARDRYVPRWFGIRGDRLVYSTGILALAAFSIVLLLAFGGSVDALLNLYAIGVFASFTLSQSGMVIHWLKTDDRNRRRKMFVNGLGAVVTAMVTLIIAVTKFAEGAWIIIVIVPSLILIFKMIHSYYAAVSRELRTKVVVKPRGADPIVVVPIPNLNLVTRQALAFAQDLSKRVIAVHVTADLAEAENIRNQWHDAVGEEVSLVIIESPYRLMLPPLLAYIDALRDTHPDDNLMVVLPEFVPKHWWQNVLHNQTALRLKAALLYRPGIAVASFPYHLAT